MDLDSVMKCVTRSSEDGLSFAELQSIARANGVETEGIRVDDLADLPKEPMIAALRHGDEGHFIVIHPIDGSPTLVLVYDQTADPKVIHIDQLISNSHWTGRVLVKKRAKLTTTQVGFLGTCAVILAAFALGYKNTERCLFSLIGPVNDDREQLMDIEASKFNYVRVGDSS